MSFHLILPFFTEELRELLLDPSISDLMINGTTGVYADRGGVVEHIPLATPYTNDRLQAAIERVARILGQDLTSQNPILNTRLPDGSRVAVVGAPSSIHGPTLTVRKFNRWFTSDELIASGSLAAEVRDTVVRLVNQKKNGIISGGTGSGNRFTLSGGLRWEFLPPPHNATSPQPFTVTGDLSNPSTLRIAPAGTAMWHASWYNFAPRLGGAWQAHTLKNWETVIRGGGGVFFDTVNQLAVDAFAGPGFSGTQILSNVPLPLTSAQQDVSTTATTPYAGLYIYPSHLQNPYTLQWNASIEQGLGVNNIATLTYVGSAGRRLAATQEFSLTQYNPLFGKVYYAANNVTSDYDALQAKFQRSVAKGLNALASYTWAHSIDFGSNSSALPLTRGNADFDVRNSFQSGITYDLPHIVSMTPVSMLLNGWGFDGRLLSRTSFPVTLQGNQVVDSANGNIYFNNVNLVPGKPIYLYGQQYPGGRSINPAAFVSPAGTTPGNAARNFVRGFGQSQVNVSARRDFALSENLHLQFRAEAFNVLNHPNFGYVDPLLTDATFGQSTMMLNQSLGTVASQYQQGGPRSMQFALRLSF